MSRTRSAARTIAINAALVVTLVGLFVSVPIASAGLYGVFRTVVPTPLDDSRGALPNYVGINWADQHFLDHKKIRSTYKDFSVWKMAPMATKTINVDQEGFRLTIDPDGVQRGEVWMFGGSAMFGVGADDSNTIPSYLVGITGRRVRNFGQLGYHARQSLNSLVDRYSHGDNSTSGGHIVVFYDGVNDVLDKCRVKNIGLGTDQEQRIRSALALDSLSAKVILMPAIALVGRIRDALDGRLMNSGFLCKDNPARSAQIAQSLVADWQAASAVAASNGGRFIAVLQPVSFLSRTRLDHLDLFRDDWIEASEQYQEVYPVIRRLAKNAGIEFYDLSLALDHDEFIYIDYSHVSPNGNEYVARALAELLP